MMSVLSLSLVISICKYSTTVLVLVLVPLLVLVQVVPVQIVLRQQEGPEGENWPRRQNRRRSLAGHRPGNACSQSVIVTEVAITELASSSPVLVQY
jgi:hypothetical protein